MPDKFCVSCGQKLEDPDVRFCPNCGASQVSQQIAMSPSSVPTEDYPCPKCAGSGKITVPFQGQRPCDYCSGSGRVDQNKREQYRKEAASNSTNGILTLIGIVIIGILVIGACLFLIHSTQSSFDNFYSNQR